MVHPILRVPAAPLAPRTRVLRLYRASLRRFNDRWADKYIQNNNYHYIRREFENNRHITNPIRINEVISEGEERLRYMCAFPERYIIPTEKKGTSFQRNTPLPRYMLDPRRWVNFDKLNEDMEKLEEWERTRRLEQLGYKGNNTQAHSKGHGHGHGHK